MYNIELAVLQNLDKSEWHTLGKISERTMIQNQVAVQKLEELNRNGIIESRTIPVSGNAESAGIEWRRHENSLENYLKDKIPW